MTLKAKMIALLVILTFSIECHAQDDGPRSYLASPDGVTVANPFWIHTSGNLDTSGSTLLKNVEIRNNIVAIAVPHYFSIKGRMSQLTLVVLSATVHGRLRLANGTTIETRHKTGLVDPLVSFRINLWGNKAMKLEEFAKTPPRFLGSALISVAPPLGSYDRNDLVNIGTNRWTFRAGLPMAIPIGNPKTQTFLEIVPTVTFFTDNKKPMGTANRISQAPLWIVESHLSRNFTPKFWGSVDFRGRVGSETTTDGVKDGNQQKHLGLGGSVGYQFTPRFAINGTFGGLVATPDGTKANMFRVKATYVWF